MLHNSEMVVNLFLAILDARTWLRAKPPASQRPGAFHVEGPTGLQPATFQVAILDALAPELRPLRTKG